MILYRGDDLLGLNYWEKLTHLRIYSQERRRERYMVIFLWKISQGLVSGYTVPFTDMNTRVGRRVEVPALGRHSVPSHIKNAKENSLRVKGALIFNLLPAVIRNSDHGDVSMFKNNLDHFLSDVPDQPTTRGLSRNRALTNSLLHQIPLMGGWIS